MPSFNPSIIIEDIDGKPVKFGTVDDPAARKEMTRLRSEIATASKDDPARVPALEEELMEVVKANQKSLTLGEAIITALRTPLKDDENLSEATKLDHMEWAVKVRQAQNAAPTETVEFTNEHFDKIKTRVNKCWPAPEVIWRLKQAVKSTEEKPALKAAD